MHPHGEYKDRMSSVPKQEQRIGKNGDVFNSRYENNARFFRTPIPTLEGKGKKLTCFILM